ncbi:MAG: hypothetical protein AAF063_07985 [Cyanobacteria bacterium J06643_5]
MDIIKKPYAKCDVINSPCELETVIGRSCKNKTSPITSIGFSMLLMKLVNSDKCRNVAIISFKLED